MAKVKPTVLLHSICEDFGTAWINRLKHNRPLDVNFRRGSTILSKKNTPHTTSESAQKRFFEARFNQLECMWKDALPWQRMKTKQYNDITKVGKSAKSAFFILGSRFKLYELLEFFGFDPKIVFLYDEENNRTTITVELQPSEQAQLEQTAQEGEWERVIRSRP